MTRRVLYISYTGLLEPLGQSQVLQYALSLGLRHQMTLLTFEKPELAIEADRLAALEEQCHAAGLDWIRIPYHRKLGTVATIYDVMIGILTARRIAREKRIQIVHCRSYIAGLMGLAVKRATGARYIFDMRGFWADERVDGGIWSRGGLPYRLFKRVERRLLQNADHVVSLTRAGVREIESFEYLQGRLPQVSVIPTCTNLDLFRPLDIPRRGFTLGYVGSAGSWYMFDEVARAVKCLFEIRGDARFLVLNKGGHASIRRELKSAGVDMARVEVREAPFDQVACQIARMDAGIFFIKPAWSKRGSCPTRMGEFLACGKPCLANDGVGDVREDFDETGTGITLPATAEGRVLTSGLKDALMTLMDLAGSANIAFRCRSAAEVRFSLSGGIAEYDRIYTQLAVPGEPS